MQGIDTRKAREIEYVIGPDEALSRPAAQMVALAKADREFPNTSKKTIDAVMVNTNTGSAWSVKVNVYGV